MISQFVHARTNSYKHRFTKSLQEYDIHNNHYEILYPWHGELVSV